MKINCWTEWGKLREILVGSTYPIDAFDYHKDLEFRDNMKRILTETQEDLDTLAKLLTDEFGVKVHRPNNTLFKVGEEHTNGYFKYAYPNHPLMPRDTIGAFGNTLVQTYTNTDSRYFENITWYDHCMDYFEQGSNWISMPSPLVLPGKKYVDPDIKPQAFQHTANFIKCGKDIFYSIPGDIDIQRGKGTKIGIDWFKRHLPEFDFNAVNIGGHVDGKIALLRPGLLATWNKNWIPPQLSLWDAIEIPDNANFPDDFVKTKKKRYYGEYVKKYLENWIGYADESVFDVNVLSVDAHRVIVTGNDPKILRLFENKGLTPIFWNFRHQYFWDGGIHCVTADMVRDGEIETYC
jgi:glycine amidinotransferase